MFSQTLRLGTRMRHGPKFLMTSQMVKRFPPIATRKYSKPPSSSFNNDGGPKVRHFLFVGIVGTILFVMVVNKINEQDPKTSLAKKKNTYSEEEWESYVAGLKRKKQRFDFSSNKEFYAIPFANKSPKQIENLKREVSNSSSQENVGVVDINELIAKQIDNPASAYGLLLKTTLVENDPNSQSCTYSFNWNLAKGIFSKLVCDELVRMTNESPQLDRFLLLNFPNSLPEAIKFEQDVANITKLIVFKEEQKDDVVVKYFDTVDKVSLSN
ncbi:BA75_01148T0 [Komagataella pastoris]|uniref:BA75_01148T0 n=1 Tax=Komagataella pastoris TaxID=4922 RepID=A0A1B2J637_PICPA|nr:BA75_01148T0 [Komagataella pastoris]